MGVSIAEYLGRDVRSKTPITPVTVATRCPFMNADCTKITGKNKPVCSVRKSNGDLWIVCKHRLCGTLKKIQITDYQKGILFEIAKTIWGDVNKDEIVFRREMRIPVVDKSSYNADYILINTNDRRNYNCPTKVVLEMQGGGETSNTGLITNVVQKWQDNPNRTNKDLSESISKAGTIETNAWRRQQEQFIIKGNIAMQTGGGIVFCVGKPLYDYLHHRIKDARLNDLRDHNWTLALLGYTEDVPADGERINLKIDPDRMLFTNYQTFVQTLINQGLPHPGMFAGEFFDLNDRSVNL